MAQKQQQRFPVDASFETRVHRQRLELRSEQECTRPLPTEIDGLFTQAISPR